VTCPFQSSAPNPPAIKLLQKCRQISPKKKFRFRNKLISMDRTVIELCASMFDWTRWHHRNSEPVVRHSIQAAPACLTGVGSRLAAGCTDAGQALRVRFGVGRAGVNARQGFLPLRNLEISNLDRLVAGSSVGAGLGLFNGCATRRRGLVGWS
jgi:hypothetical protein